MADIVSCDVISGDYSRTLFERKRASFDVSRYFIAQFLPNLKVFEKLILAASFIMGCNFAVCVNNCATMTQSFDVKYNFKCS